MEAGIQYARVPKAVIAITTSGLRSKGTNFTQRLEAVELIPDAKELKSDTQVTMCTTGSSAKAKESGLAHATCVLWRRTPGILTRVIP
jgi:hypothetical protein